MANTNNKTPTPELKTPEKTTRELLIERVVDDFTYKGKLNKQQTTMLEWVKDAFEALHIEIGRMFDFSDIKARLVLTGEFQAFQLSTREVERWANTAIVNDWKTTDKFDEALTVGLTYPVNEPTNVDERIKLSYEVSKRCFELATALAQLLPEGRALSIALTELQVARGWLLDTINFN